MRIAVCGGVYSNPYGLRAFIDDARCRGARRLYCLGDLGGYGGEPEAVWPLLKDNDIVCIAGNYDDSIARNEPDCGCGYSDPRDQQYAQLMYDYTVKHTSAGFAAWMGTLPTERRETLDGCEVHFVHGSPLALNDFWWESLSAQAHATRVAASGAEVIVATHTGLPWVRRVENALVVNVGVLGRPANDGTTEVNYALIDTAAGASTARIIALRYDWKAQARSMRSAGLPEAFVRTNETGWWTTCLQILPAVERSRGRYHVYDSSVPALLAAAGIPAPWPDSDPGIPVRSLLGSPLFPARIWVEGRARRTAKLVAHAEKAGIRDIRVLGEEKPPPLSTAPGFARPLPELTLTAAGWHWHPDLSDGAPITAVETPGEAGTAEDVDSSVRGVVYRLLTELENTGALIPPRYCVA
jgi:predicted phosphodiesterase